MVKDYIKARRIGFSVDIALDPTAGLVFEDGAGNSVSVVMDASEVVTLRDTAAVLARAMQGLSFEEPRSPTRVIAGRADVRCVSRTQPDAGMVTFDTDAGVVELHLDDKQMRDLKRLLHVTGAGQPLDQPSSSSGTPQGVGSPADGHEQ